MDTKRRRERECDCCGRIHGEECYIVGASFDLIVQAMLILIPERRVAHEKNIENDTWKNDGEIRTSRAQQHSPHAQISTDLPYGSFLSTSGLR